MSPWTASPAATATPGVHLSAGQWLLLILSVLLVAAGYATACWWWPFMACTHCDGGKIRSPSGKAWRRCRRCKGSGARIRTGRRIFNWLHVTMKEKT